MKLLMFILGLVAGAIGVFGWVIYQDSNRQREDKKHILFADKNFYDPGLNVFISGTLTGKNIGYPDNTYGVSCYSMFKACFVAYVEQWGPELIGRMETPADYPIVKWNDNEVVAQQEPGMFACYRVTITIDRKMKTLLWLEEPINQTKATCRDADTNIRKYTIEDPPGRKKMKDQLRQ